MRIEMTIRLWNMKCSQFHFFLFENVWNHSTESYIFSFSLSLSQCLIAVNYILSYVRIKKSNTNSTFLSVFLSFHWLVHRPRDFLEELNLREMKEKLKGELNINEDKKKEWKWSLLQLTQNTLFSSQSLRGGRIC